MLSLTRPVFIIIHLSPSYCLIWAFIPRYRRAESMIYTTQMKFWLIPDWIDLVFISGKSDVLKSIVSSKRKRHLISDQKREYYCFRAFGPWIVNSTRSRSDRSGILIRGLIKIRDFNGVEHLYLAPPKNTEAIAAPSPAYGRLPLNTSELFTY